MQFGCSDEAGPGRAPGCGSKWLQVVLFEPEIAANTGAIGRTCLALDVRIMAGEAIGFQA